MADISMCCGYSMESEGKVTVCALKESCYRYLAPADDYGQSMMDFVHHDYDKENKTCKSYMSIHPEKKEREN